MLVDIPPLQVLGMQNLALHQAQQQFVCTACPLTRLHMSAKGGMSMDGAFSGDSPKLKVTVAPSVCSGNVYSEAAG